MVFRRELALLIPRGDRPRHPLEKRPTSHDTWLYIVAAALGRISHIAEPLILYRQHGANAFGMTVPDWRARLHAMRTVPIETYREREIFYGALVAVFDALATRADDALAPRARAAAERYRHRQWIAHTRTHIHASPSLAQRATAFRLLHAAPMADRLGLRARTASMAKDALLGVTGWGRPD
jgi:hypothetical protein